MSNLDPTALWTSVLEALATQGRYNPRTIETFLRPLQPLDVSGDLHKSVLLLEAPNEFARDWAARNFARAIEEQLAAGTGITWELHFTVRPASAVTAVPVSHEVPSGSQGARESVPPARPSTPPTPPPRTAPRPAAARSASMPESRSRAFESKKSDRSDSSVMTGAVSSGLRPNFSFGTFVVGPSNQLAHAAAHSMGEPGGRRFNPLFLCGPSGLGKTHLANAIGHRWLEHFPGGNVVYISAEHFTNEFICAVQTKTMDDFRGRYRNHCDALLIDDIQFLAGKEQTLDEFFHTFNALIQRDKPIVLTSDVMPQDLKGMPDRLVSRFASGMVAEVYPPELETRVAILRKKASIEGVALDDEAAFLLANTVTANMRELEGALMKLSIQASIAKCTMIDAAMVRHALRIPSRQHVITVEDIQKATAQYFRVTLAQLSGKERHAEIARARQVAMYVCREKLGTSFPQIGAKFGGKDHTTVISSVNKIKKLLESGDPVRGEVDAVLAKLGG
ncbi:MAG: chromosomal replication initiator protein DnaA [Deltaproteobacteria bacterium]|nr:chromosomal replication initiator protein DnaA [Deltaproteobacteria bacterium]